jgi:hypothetical protein
VTGKLEKDLWEISSGNVLDTLVFKKNWVTTKLIFMDFFESD